MFQLVEGGWRTTEVKVIQIAEQVLSILIYFCSQKPLVIHRDIKPHNLIRSDDGEIFLVDFDAVQNAYYDTWIWHGNWCQPKGFCLQSEEAVRLFTQYPNS